MYNVYMGAQMNDLQMLQDFIDEVNKSNLTNEKKEVLKKYSGLQKMFRYVYDEMIQFSVTSENIKKRRDIDINLGTSYPDIYSLLDALANRDITGHAALTSVQKFVDANSQFEEVIYRILDKNLKTRLDSTLINKTFPGCIPTFDVALANKYQDRAKKVFFDKEIWVASRKLDGCRCICRVDSKGKARFFSRKGKEFFTLEKVRNDVEALCLENIVFDGEICLVDDNGNESFDGIIKLIKRKDYNIEHPKYKIFDLMSAADFDKQSGDIVFWDRYMNLKTVILKGVNATLDLVEQWKIKSTEHFEDLRAQAIAGAWEGLIIRKNVGYEGKRSDNMLKVKEFETEEMKVIRTINGPIRVIENGIDVEKELLSAFVVDYKGFEVNVGSGLSQEQRVLWYKNPQNIVGKYITVKYFEVTHDQKGSTSLRFPTFVCVRDYEE